MAVRKALLNTLNQFKKVTVVTKSLCLMTVRKALPGGCEESPLNTLNLWALEKFTKVAYNHYVHQGL